MRPVGGELELDHGRAQDFDILLQGGRIENQRAAGFHALVGRLVMARAIRAPGTAGTADRLGRADGQGLAGSRCLARDKPAGLRLIARPRRHRILDPGAQHRLLHDSGVATLKPLVPPAQAFLRKTDLRARHAEMRIFMRPGPH